MLFDELSAVGDIPKSPSVYDDPYRSVYDTEVTFKAQHKAEGLLERWRKANVAFWNPERSPEPARA